MRAMLWKVWTLNSFFNEVAASSRQLLRVNWIAALMKQLYTSTAAIYSLYKFQWRFWTFLKWAEKLFYPLVIPYPLVLRWIFPCRFKRFSFIVSFATVASHRRDRELLIFCLAFTIVLNFTFPNLARMVANKLFFVLWYDSVDRVQTERWK